MFEHSNTTERRCKEKVHGHLRLAMSNIRATDLFVGSDAEIAQNVVREWASKSDETISDGERLFCLDRETGKWFQVKRQWIIEAIMEFDGARVVSITKDSPTGLMVGRRKVKLTACRVRSIEKLVYMARLADPADIAVAVSEITKAAA